MLPNSEMDYLFEATVEACGRGDHQFADRSQDHDGVRGTVNALPQDLLVEILRKHNRLAKVPGS